MYAVEILEKALSLIGFTTQDNQTGISAMEEAKSGPSNNLPDSEAARFFYWISPNFNMDMFIFLLPLMLIPAALVWIYVIYPPGKFYANVPFNHTDTVTVFNATVGLFRKKRNVGVDPIPIVLKKFK